jgi:SAM-dependent methyltransferase
MAASDSQHPVCPVCEGSEYRDKYRLTHFSILDCTTCDLVFLWPRPTEEEIRELFENLYTKGEGSVPELKSYYSFCYDDEPSNPLVQLYETWLDKIEAVNPPGKILDIGSGTGLFLSVARRRGWEPFGIDESEEATAHARDHFGLDVRIGEFSQFAREGLSFDAITGWDIIEHAREPVSLVRAARESLAPGGVMGLSTPNQSNIIDLIAKTIYRLSARRVKGPLEKFYIEQHFIYFTDRTLTDALRRGGMEVISTEKELTDLRRLTLSPVMRLVLQGMFASARVLGLENRLFTLAQVTREVDR